MPWILKRKCIGCKKCVKKCPVDAIFMSKSKAIINEHTCKYCAKCVKVCPVHAILKDKEKAKMDVENNIKLFKKKIKKHKNPVSKKGMLKAELKQLDRQKRVIKETIRKLKSLKPR